MSYYGDGPKPAWPGAKALGVRVLPREGDDVLEDEGMAYGRRARSSQARGRFNCQVELLKAVRDHRQQMDLKDEQLEEQKRKLEHFQEELARCLDPEEAVYSIERVAPWTGPRS